MVSSVNCPICNCNTVNVMPTQEYAKYSYAVDINGKKQTASVEETPDGKVTIKVGDGKNEQTINTDKEGLMKFNQQYMQKPDLYSNKDSSCAADNTKNGWSEKAAAALQALVATRMMMGGGVNNNNQMMQDHLTAMQMHQQAVDMAQMAHNTAVQMSTPGMGII